MSPWLGTVLRNRKRLLTIKCPNCWAVVWRVRRVLCPCSAWALEHCDDPKVDASFIPKARKPSLIAPTFSDPSFKSVSYLTRNEQSVVTSFFFSANWCNLELMGFICLADQQLNIILITPVTLGRTSSFWANLIRVVVPTTAQFCCWKSQSSLPCHSESSLAF